MSTITAFMDLNVITTGQNPSDKYGVIDNEHFRVSSVFTLTSSTLAYAVTNGLVFVQPQKDPLGGYSSTKMNMVLKPNKQLANGLPKIKYFIYRGIDTADLYSGPYTAPTIIPAASTNSDYLKRHYLDFNAAKTNGFYSGYPAPDNNPTVPSPLRTGMQRVADPLDTLLDSIFAEEQADPGTNVSIVMVPISEGQTLGHFLNGKIGFDIVLEDRSSVITLADVQAPENIITASTATGTPGSLTIDKMSEREKILAYMDPAAFFMAYGAEGHSIDNKTAATTVGATYTGWNNVYNNVVSKFATKNTVYIDIRNEYGYSINYAKDNEGNSSLTDHNKHFQLGINTTPGPEVYYKSYWPIYTIDTTATVSGGSWLALNFNFWRTYNPVPVIYSDYSWDMIGSTPVERLGSQKFWVDNTYDTIGNRYNHTTTIVTSHWSNEFSCYTPVVSATRCAFYVKLYVNRRYVPDDVPITAFKRDHYLDNIFGPVLEIDKLKQIYTAKPTQWFCGLGRRYVNISSNIDPTDDDPNMLIECMVDVGVSISATQVLFYATINEYQYQYSSGQKITPDIKNKNRKGTGASNTSSVYSARNPENKATFKTDSPLTYSYNYSLPGLPTPMSGALIIQSGGGDNSIYDIEFNALFSRTQYENWLYPAAQILNMDVHYAYLNFDSMQEDEATSTGGKPNIFVKHCEIRVSGYNSAGDYQVENAVGGGKVQVASKDGFHYSSADVVLPDPYTNIDTRPAALVHIDDFITYVGKIEEHFDETDNFISVQDPVGVNVAKKTATRIRVHSYGRARNNPWQLNLKAVLQENFKKLALEKAVCDAPYLAYPHIPVAVYPGLIISNRNLELLDDEPAGSDLKNIYQALTAHADESWILDNPSPYLQIPKPHHTSVIENVDLGQVLFGFESLVTLGIGSRTTFKGYADYFNIFDPFDLASVVANIATPISNFFAENTLVPNRSTPDKGIPQEIRPAFTDIFLQIDAYYQLSAPSTDLIGNADGVGMMNAYARLSGTSKTLSDVLKLYYKSDAGTHAVNTSIPYYTVENRWLMFCLFMNLIEETSSTTITWLPDHLSSAWYGSADLTPANTAHYFSFQNKKYLVEKMKRFTIFWMNILINPVRSGFDIIDDWFIMSGFKALDNTHAVYPGSKTEETFFEDLASYILDNKFLPFVKSKLQDEQVGKTII